MYDVSPCYRGRRFRELAQIGAVSAVLLERAREQARLRKRHPPGILRSPGPQTDWNSDWRCTGLQITAWQDFSHPQGVCNSSKTEQKGGGWQGGATVRLLAKLHPNVHQNIIFEVMSEVQKDLEDISAEIGIFVKNKVLYKFSCNLR